MPLTNRAYRLPDWRPIMSGWAGMPAVKTGLCAWFAERILCSALCVAGNPALPAVS